MQQSFEDFLRGLGFDVRGPVIPGSGITRFRSLNSKGNDKPLWAVLHEEGRGTLGSWNHTIEKQHWESGKYKAEPMTPEKKARIAEQNRQLEIKLREESERQARANLAAWEAIRHTDTISPYLVKKGVDNYGLKIDAQGNAYMPMLDIDGKLWNYQNISVSPKLFREGSVRGCFHKIPGNDAKIIIASGYATAASIHQETGFTVIACGGDGNMITVAGILKQAGWKNLIAACDNDSDKKGKSGNVTAEKISKLYGIKCVMPDTPGDFNDHAVEFGNNIYSYFFQTIPAFSLEHYLADRSPMPEDVIAPRVLTQGGMLVFGGAPKVGKSDFILTWLMHMAAGEPFLGMTPPRPLKVFYIQAEVQYDYLRERIQAVNLTHDARAKASRNIVITQQTRMLLDESGVLTAGNTIRHHFPHEKPDIIAIDPIANLYDQESENDNAQMMAFLSKRVEALRDYAAPHTAFVLVHHTKKVAKDELGKDPFQMFSGASSLRRYYTTGMVMWRPDEELGECMIAYEVRNGPRIPNLRVDKDLHGSWYTVTDEQSRVVKKAEQAIKAADYERNEQKQTVRENLANDILMGKVCKRYPWAKAYQNTLGLPNYRKIVSMIDELLLERDSQFTVADDESIQLKAATPE